MYPIDMHSFAQAVITLLKVGGKAADAVLCERVLQRAIELMYLPKKQQFIYQKTDGLAIESITPVGLKHGLITLWLFITTTFSKVQSAQLQYLNKVRANEKN